MSYAKKYTTKSTSYKQAATGEGPPTRGKDKAVGGRALIQLISQGSAKPSAPALALALHYTLPASLRTTKTRPPMYRQKP